ncbi:Zn-dependent exopeptidase [Schizophyllum commune H4-8]|nr:Zn-dependent exopeptidase [Schizophyllum commune H4-8]KAI5888233.1 Zn-dependent exopeptidase [Schizophyllum commune H4-8]
MQLTFPSIDEAECLRTLQDIVRIKSYSQTQGEIDVTNHVARVMKEMGVEGGVYPFDGGARQNAIGRWRGSGGGKTLLFNGHMDTNPVGEGWTVDPWGGIVKDDNCIYGIGVSNMKAGCAAYLCAVRTLVKAGWKLKGDVILTFVVGELQGGPGTVAAIEQGHCDADYFVNCEPSDVRAITMHAESEIFEIALTGVTRHMSKREEATDVILAASDLVPRLTDLTFPNAPSPVHASINRCHVGVIRAGLGKEMAEWRPPQVADYAVIKGAARIAPGQTGTDVREALTTACNATVTKFPELKYEIIPVEAHGMPSFEVNPGSRIVRSLNTAYAAVRGVAQPTGAIKPICFYGSDAGHLYRKLGMEGVVCGPGGKYNTMPDERVELEDYYDCIRIFVRLIVDICGVDQVPR